MNTVASAHAASRKKGMALVLTAATLWGVSGSVAQYLFQHHQFSAEWLTVTRLLISGILILCFSYTRQKKAIWNIWKRKQDRISIVIFSIFGMLAIQYTYLAAINHSNAATATVLQYLSPVIITCYLVLLSRRLPKLSIVLVVLLAIIGTFLLVTGGNLKSLAISGWALFWGLGSAFASAFYTLYPKHLLARFDSLTLVGWAMLLGGLFFSLVHQPWNVEGQWTSLSLLAFSFVVLFGTAMAFFLYLHSLKFLGATEVSVLGCAEPLSAALLSVVWLHVPFGAAEWFGTACILSTILLLTRIKSDLQ